LKWWNGGYILGGGLVDETVTKKVTLSKCEELKLVTRSLPIEKYMVRKQQHLPDEQKPTYNKILTINQVFDILAPMIARASTMLQSRHV
jgi:hypothetical protein